MMMMLMMILACKVLCNKITNTTRKQIKRKGNMFSIFSYIFQSIFAKNIEMNVYILEGREDKRVCVHGLRIIEQVKKCCA